MKTLGKFFAAVLLAIVPAAPAVAQSDWYGVEDYCPIYLNLVIDEIPLSVILDNLHDNISPYTITAYLDGMEVAQTRDLIQAGGYSFFILKVPGTAEDIGKDITFQVGNEGGESIEETSFSVKFTLESIGQPSEPLILNLKTSNYGRIGSVEQCDTIFIGRGKTIELVKEMVRVTPANAQYEITECYAVLQDGIIEVSGTYMTAVGSGTAEVAISVTDITGSIYTVYVPVVVVIPIEKFEFLKDEIALYTDETLNWATLKTMWEISPADARQDVTLESSDLNVFRIEDSNLIPVSTGSAVLTVRTTDPDFYGDIKVSVVKVPEYAVFSTEKLILDGRSESSLTITFMPEDCWFERVRMSYEIVNPEGVPEDWSIVDMDGGTADGRQITFNMSSYSSGTCTLNVMYRDRGMGSLPIVSSAAIDLTDGWSWISVPDADILKSEASVKELLGGVLVEARTQECLWVNDPVYGIVGTGKSMAGKCVKMNMDNTGSLQKRYLSFLGVEKKERQVSVASGWTWFSYPYEYEYPLSTLDMNMEWSRVFEEGTMIVSKSDGFVTLDGFGEWSGTLESLKPGQGYMLFNAAGDCSFTWVSEYVLGQPYTPEEEPLPIQSRRGVIDHSRFADNMCVIARMPDGVPAGSALNAYVGGELRGTAKPGPDGTAFLTVHGTSGEKVSFSAGDSFMFGGTLDFTQKAGTLDSPFVPGTRTSAGAVYDLKGRRLDIGLPSDGTIYIIDGRKVSAIKGMP